MAADIVELILPMSDRTDPQLAFNTRSGGMALSGQEQIVTPLSERWTFAAVFPIRNKTDGRVIRVVKSKLKGRANYLLLRICDQFRITRKDIGAHYPEAAVRHLSVYSLTADSSTPTADSTVVRADFGSKQPGAWFSDGSGYKLASPSSPVMVAAPINADTVTIRASDFAGAMTAGVFFDIDYWLYQVDDWSLVDGNYVLQISPPLRAPVAVGAIADFDAKSLWQLASDSEGTLQLAGGRLGAVTLNLVEPVGR